MPVFSLHYSKGLVKGFFVKLRAIGIHRLTETFLLQEVIKWTADEDVDS